MKNNNCWHKINKKASNEAFRKSNERRKKPI